MAEFQMPMSSIPNSKIYINENTMKKIMDQNKGQNINQTKGFCQMFTNVICDLSNVETSTDTSSRKNISGPKFVPSRKDQFRYHVQKPPMQEQSSIRRVHRMPVDKKIIRTSIMPKIKQEEQQVDQGICLVPANPNKEFRSQSFKERPHYLDKINYKAKIKVELDPPKEITGKSFDIKMTYPTKDEATDSYQYINFQNLKQEIENALKKCSPKKVPEINDDNEQSKIKLPPSYMFIEDDRDRFGKQIFPISMPYPHPGPGQYEQDYTSLNHKVNKILEKNTQRRLVQLWQQQY